MIKSIEQWRQELKIIFKKNSEEYIKLIHDCQDEIVIAFQAKYGLRPEEAFVCEQFNEQGNKFWVEKRDDLHIQYISEHKIKTIEDLFSKYLTMLKLVKRIARICEWDESLADDAIKLLEEFGEIDNE